MPRIAVVTPYYKETTSTLLQCIHSVSAQSVPADHFMVADGYANHEILSENIRHVILPQAHSDNGNTPRGIGSLLAASEGYDFVAYLDADNWYHPNHLSSLLDLWESTRSEVCTSFRTIHALDGTQLTVEEPDEQSLAHVDTSCFLIQKTAFKIFNIWLDMPKVLSPICDRIFFSALTKQRYRFESTKKKTVAFRTQYKAHYLASGLIPPIDAKDNVGQEAYKWLMTLDGVRSVVDKLGFYPI